MRQKKVCLRAVMALQEGKRVWTGEYACSACGQRFRPDAADPEKLSLEFSTHKEKHHAEGGAHQDFNRVAS